MLAGPHQEAAGHELLHVDPLEAGRSEEGAELAFVVVEDRAVVDPLVADLADRALEPGPTREARDGRAATELEHPAGEAIGLVDVVEETEGDDDVELALQQLLQEVPCDEARPIPEAREPLPGQVDHLPGEVDPHVLGRPGLDQLLPDAAGTAADVEDPWALEGPDQVDRGLGPEKEAGPQQALQAVVLYLVVVELVK